MRVRNIAIFMSFIFVAAVAGSLVGPRPAQAVAREIIELQHDVTTLLQGQKDLATQMTQDHTVMKTLVEQTGEPLPSTSSASRAHEQTIAPARLCR
jgi:hypothetical protein